MIKKLCLFIGGMSISLTAQAQDFKTAGRLLKNEHFAPIKDMSSRSHNNYQWIENYNFGYCEVFIRIPEKGRRFSIRLGDQEISNSTGFFRFFDVPADRQELSIGINNLLIYKVQLYPQNNTRMVLDFFLDEGLYLLDEVDLRKHSYVYGTGWNDIWNNPYQSSRLAEMPNALFNKFMASLKKEHFDDGKLKVFRMRNKNFGFSTLQIKNILQSIVFEETKLIIAKEAYEDCVDPENYYDLNDGFNNPLSKEEFYDFLSLQKNR